MTLSTYISIQQIVMSALVALGAHLTFANIPSKLKRSNIHIACRIVGISITILPFASLIFYFFGLRELNPLYPMAVNLTSYCLTSTFLTLAYYILLDQIVDKTFIKIHLTIGLIYPFPLWIGLCCGSEFIRNHVTIMSYTIFCVLAVIHISTCIYFYRQKCIRLKESMSKLEEIELKLIRRTIYVSIALLMIGICSPSSSSYPIWLAFVFVLCFISGAIYIYVCFYKMLNYNINSLIESEIEATETTEIIEVAEDKPEPTKVAINDEVMVRIERNIQLWIDTKGFLEPDTSINHVAKIIGTNRTYLSRYINRIYENQFKNWITQQRIKEAKEIMCRDPKLSISDIAQKTGFSSIESFSHTFTRCEQISPSKWREINARSNK